MRAPGGTGGHPGERREEEGQGGSGKGEGERASLGDEPSALRAAADASIATGASRAAA